VIDGGFLNLPRGVDQYLELRKAQGATGGPARATPTAKASGLSGGERRTLEKELGSVDRRMQKAHESIAALRVELGTLDPSDYTAMGERQAAISKLETDARTLEERWLEVSALLEG
jgi:ABC transport system ATP-binding/permease protein